MTTSASPIRLSSLAIAAVAVLTLAAPASAHSVEVTARSGLNVRSGPSTRYRRLGVARHGERMTHLGRSGSWIKVNFRGQAGWAYGSYLRAAASTPSRTSTTTSNASTASASRTGVITASALNVRSGPSTRYRVLGSLRRGTQVRVTRQSGSWLEIALRSGTGWVHGAYVSIGGRTAATAPTTTSSGTSSAGFVQLPTSGNGYYGYYAASKRWGLPRLVYGIQRVAARLQRDRPSAPRLGVGDLSLRNGGDIAGHASHERGVDADLRPLRNDGREAPVTIFQSAYSRSHTQHAFDLFVSELTVTHIFFNDSRTRHTQRWPNHDNHFHVRIR